MEPYLHHVQYYETDRMGITHHSNYIRWMEEARVAFLEELGWGYEKLENMGIVSPVTQAACEFKKPTTFSDVVEITVEVREYRGVRLLLSYRMVNERTKELVAEGTSGHCFLNREGQVMILKKEHPEFDKILKELAQADPAENKDR
ncbi:MAG: acyl-CoA thioesterase [Lacrimispora saccharolytica]